MNDLLPILRELCDAFGPSGFEDEVRQAIRGYVAPLVDEITESPLGNIIATRRGEDPGKTVLLDAHVDEVGLIVTSIEPDGFLRFAPLGGVDPRVVPSHRVQVRAKDGAKRLGVIGMLPPHVTKPEDRGKALEHHELYIDLGCASSEEVRALGVEVGSPAVIDAEFSLIQGGCITAKALDDRAGCTVLIGALEAFRDAPPPVNLVATFTIQEETGGLGAHTAAHVVEPRAALALEGTTATDTPGVPPHKMACALRKGPAITIADVHTIVPERMVRYLEQCAKNADIPCQRKTPKIGSTNGRLYQAAKAGVVTGILNVPCRYIHSSTSVLHPDDLENTRRLAAEFVRNLPEF